MDYFYLISFQTYGRVFTLAALPGRVFKHNMQKYLIFVKETK